MTLFPRFTGAAVGLAVLTTGSARAEEGAAEERVTVMPTYKVTAGLVSDMIPCRQVLELSREVAARFKSFEVSVLTAAPAGSSTKPLRCFIRDADGHVRRELTNESQVFPIEATWGDGFLSTNYGEGAAGYYLMLKPRFPAEQITVGDLETLLDEYTDFARRRLDVAISRYGTRNLRTGDLYWRVMPTEVVCVATSPEVARALASRCGAVLEGSSVRIAAEVIEDLKKRNGAGWVVTKRSEMTCVAPWTRVLGLPHVKDSAALYEIGWMEYRSDVMAKPQREVIAVAMW